MKLLLFAIATAAATTAAAQTAKRPPVLAAPVPPAEANCIKLQAKPVLNDTTTIFAQKVVVNAGDTLAVSKHVLITASSVITTHKVQTSKTNLTLIHD